LNYDNFKDLATREQISFFCHVKYLYVKYNISLNRVQSAKSALL
jgi:hypothetical protein